MWRAGGSLAPSGRAQCIQVFYRLNEANAIADKARALARFGRRARERGLELARQFATTWDHHHDDRNAVVVAAPPGAQEQLVAANPDLPEPLAPLIAPDRETVVFVRDGQPVKATGFVNFNFSL